MHDVPQPQLLDPDRVRTDTREEMTPEQHQNRAKEIAAALHESCAYAQQLWDELDTARRYLVDRLPDSAFAPDALAGASPTGPDDKDGWQAWIEAYARITSILAGPHGDSGFALDEGRQIARARLEFSGGSEPTAETIEGPAAVPAPEPAPLRQAVIGQAAALAAGVVLGWIQGRSSAARRQRRASRD